ncbi:hypothetical protein DWF00_08275 [Bosea caraganae]|uniref:Uncharacterized protein n=1 Tax=Bosea caraganae TaxID=2763117 RepID=A0A370LAN5_9HYPH|nr:hypothetical protein DWF00_08275 [Bosea caraganae]RDJ29022.1 hypothetical protein DWE98_00050 [Bosea caraganae]
MDGDQPERGDDGPPEIRSLPALSRARTGTYDSRLISAKSSVFKVDLALATLAIGGIVSMEKVAVTDQDRERTSP